MNRVQLMEIAERTGYRRGEKNPASVLGTIRSELETYFDTEEGRFALSQAPRAMLYTSGNNGVEEHLTTKDLAINLLMQEFENG